MLAVVRRPTSCRLPIPYSRYSQSGGACAITVVQFAPTSLSASCGDFCSDSAADNPLGETDEQLQPLC